MLDLVSYSCCKLTGKSSLSHVKTNIRNLSSLVNIEQSQSTRDRDFTCRVISTCVHKTGPIYTNGKE